MKSKLLISVKSAKKLGYFRAQSCVFRVVWIYTVFAHFKTIPSLYLLYIFSWTITAAVEAAYFAVSYRRAVKASGGAA